MDLNQEVNFTDGPLAGQTLNLESVEYNGTVYDVIVKVHSSAWPNGEYLISEYHYAVSSETEFVLFSSACDGRDHRVVYPNA